MSGNKRQMSAKLAPNECQELLMSPKWAERHMIPNISIHEWVFFFFLNCSPLQFFACQRLRSVFCVEVLDLWRSFSCPFRRGCENRIHFPSEKRKDIANEVVCPSRALELRAESSRAPSGSTAPSCGGGKKSQHSPPNLQIKRKWNFLQKGKVSQKPTKAFGYEYFQ